MQIFGLNTNPVVSAQQHCDVHVTKICTEAAQLLFAALSHHSNYTPVEQGYAVTHAKVPLAYWVAASVPHFRFTLAYGIALCDRFQEIQGHGIKTRAALLRIEQHLLQHGFPPNMLVEAPTVLEWHQWMEEHGLELKSEPKTATINPPHGCKFGLLAIEADCPIEFSNDWVETYTRYYVRKNEIMRRAMKFNKRALYLEEVYDENETVVAHKCFKEVEGKAIFMGIRCAPTEADEVQRVKRLKIE